MGLHVISLGGSLIVPNEIDFEFLCEFKKFILKRIRKGDRFVLITGGGKTARRYQLVAEKVLDIDDSDKDWLGIFATRINGHLLRTIFKNEVHQTMIEDLNKDLKKIKFNEKILIGTGWKPGFSSDYVAVLLAQKFKAEDVINLSNVEYVYNEDPKTNSDAKKYERICWDEFCMIVGDTWNPGMSVPFDPIASKKCKQIKLKVAIINGRDLSSLENYLDGKKFTGTLIE